MNSANCGRNGTKNLRIKAPFALILLIAILLPKGAESALPTSPIEAKIERAAALPPSQERGGRAWLGGITPHHDIALDMIVQFYGLLASDEVRRVWLFSPDHFQQTRKMAAVGDGDWATAGKILKADREACERIGALKMAEANRALFVKEHGVTLHIPLIARYFPNATVVPIVLNRHIPDTGLAILEKVIGELLGDGDLIILSMDLSHYKTPEEMAAEDEKTLEVLKNLRFTDTPSIDVDTRRGAALVLRLLKARGAVRGEVIAHMDSSDILGRRIESGTSYGAILYGREEGF